jgi:endonuclease/exonuclease/phosphatase family metal-dependent hydrolase
MRRLARWALGGLLALGGGAALAGQPPSIELATYNLRLNLAEDGADAWPQREAAVKALIRYHELDIVSTQEGLIEQIEALEAMPGWARVGVGRDDGKKGGEHSAIFFRTERFALQRHGDFWLSATPDKPSISWDSRCCHRLATWAQLQDKATGKAFVVISVHFDHEGVVSRRESAKLLLRQMAELGQGLPVLCTGDFNAVPESEPIQTMLSGPAASRLRDARAISETPPYGPVGTFNGFKIDAAAPDRIDHVFVTPGVRILKYGVLTDSARGHFPSDHFPLVTRVLLP